MESVADFVIGNKQVKTHHISVYDHRRYIGQSILLGNFQYLRRRRLVCKTESLRSVAFWRGWPAYPDPSLVDGDGLSRLPPGDDKIARTNMAQRNIDRVRFSTRAFSAVIQPGIYHHQRSVCDLLPRCAGNRRFETCGRTKPAI